MVLRQNFSLPVDCVLRKATPEDIWAIRFLVFGAKLDPTQLLWQQFWVIEHNHKLIACCQLRNFPQAQELGSLVVTPKWRHKGLGTFLTSHLIQQATQPLYLECLGRKLVDFYRRLNFVPIEYEQLPESLKRKFGLSNLGKKLVGVPVTYMGYRE